MPFSPEWRAHWDEKFDRALYGDDSVDLREGTLDYIDLIVAEADAENRRAGRRDRLPI